MTEAVSSYAVVWRKDAGPIVPGQLRFEPEGVRLVGAVHGQAEEHLVEFGELAVVRLGRDVDERVNGRSSLLLELRSRGRFFISAIGGVGVVTELADRVVAAMSLASGPCSRR